MARRGVVVARRRALKIGRGQRQWARGTCAACNATELRLHPSIREAEAQLCVPAAQSSGRCTGLGRRTAAGAAAAAGIPRARPAAAGSSAAAGSPAGEARRRAAGSRRAAAAGAVDALAWEAGEGVGV